MKYLKYIIFVLVLILIIPFNVFAVDLIDTYSKSVIVYDLDEDKVVYNRDGSTRRYVASLTKIVTTITAIDMIEANPDINWTDTITITNKMVTGLKWDASRAGLKAGDVVTYEDLLYAIMLPSGADATQSIAYSLSGTLTAFVDEMNKKAEELNMTSSHFVNTHGLDVDNHYSTADDILKVLKYAFANEIFKKVYTTKKYTLTNGLTVNSTIRYYNSKLDYDTSRVLGSKTGYTDNAGTCITAYFVSNGHNYLYVSLGAPYVYGQAYHLKDLLTVIDFMDTNYNDMLLSQIGEPVTTINIKYGNIDTYEVKTSQNISKYLPIDYDNNLFEIKYDGVTNLNALALPDKDTKIGTITYLYDNEVLSTEEVYFTEEVNFELSKFIIENQSLIQKYLIYIAASFGALILLIILIRLLIVIFKKK